MRNNSTQVKELIITALRKGPVHKTEIHRELTETHGLPISQLAMEHVIKSLMDNGQVQRTGPGTYGPV